MKYIVMLEESVLKSWLKDTWTFGTFVVVITINYFLFDNNGVVAFFLIFLWFIWVIARAKSSKKFYDENSAIKYIKDFYKTNPK